MTIKANKAPKHRNIQHLHAKLRSGAGRHASKVHEVDSIQEGLDEMSEIATFDDFVRALKPHPTLRMGQHAMNLLFEARPDLYARISTSNVDPFYSDDRLGEALAFLENNW